MKGSNRDPGVGLGQDERRVQFYTDLKSLRRYPDQRKRKREPEIRAHNQVPPDRPRTRVGLNSKKIPGQEDAQGAINRGATPVNECYRCHPTTFWNDILGVGYYKHT